MNSKPAPAILPAVLLLAFSAMPARSAVTYWSAEKGADYLQISANTQPVGATNWYAASFVGTDLPYP